MPLNGKSIDIVYEIVVGPTKVVMPEFETVAIACNSLLQIASLLTMASVIRITGKFASFIRRGRRMRFRRRRSIKEIME